MVDVNNAVHTLINGLSDEAARAALTGCCGAFHWVEAMLSRRPFASSEDLYDVADEVWSSLSTDDHLEAFSHHPPIGASLESLRARFPATAASSAQEQAGVADAEEETLKALRAANQQYLERFGFIFIVCASGKTGSEMLALLRLRLANDHARELSIAAEEQRRITRLRLERLTPWLR